MPTNRVFSTASRLKSVSDMARDAIIGPAGKTARPMSHGPMNTKPQNASRKAGPRKLGRRRPAGGPRADDPDAPDRVAEGGAADPRATVPRGCERLKGPGGLSHGPGQLR